MRIRILSDLHREFGPTEIPQIDSDLIILAGDIATKQNGLQWVANFSKATPTAYVCGNHEFYGDKLPRVTERLIEATHDTNIHVLEDDFFTVHGWHIYGCTLWTDLALGGDWGAGSTLANECMNDYKRIRNSIRGFRKLSPKDTRNLHHRSLERMTKFFNHHDPKRTIIVTHHAPSALSLPEKFRAESISCAYASQLDEFIRRYQPPLWIHGHIHHSSDYYIGSTRVVSNPQSYPGDLNQGFDPVLIIEI